MTARCDLLDGTPTGNALREILCHVMFFTTSGLIILFLDQQPIFLPLSISCAHSDQVPQAMQLLTVQAEFQTATTITFQRVSNRSPRSPIPQHDRSCAILFRRNDPFKTPILKRMVLHMDSQTLVCGIQAGPFRNSPAFQCPVQFQSKVIMETAGSMFLNDELWLSRWGLRCAWRFGGIFEVTFLPILLKAHMCFTQRNWYSGVSVVV